MTPLPGVWMKTWLELMDRARWLVIREVDFLVANLVNMFSEILKVVRI